MKKILFIVEKIKKMPRLQAIFVFCFFLLTASSVYLTVDNIVSIDDPLFHIRFAEIIRKHGFGVFKDFKWIYFSNMAQHQSYFIYYNFIFYIALIPFTFFVPLFLGLKAYGIIFISLVFTSIFLFLRSIKERAPFLWVFFFFVLFNSSNVLRFLMARPFTLAPALLLCELYFLHKRRYYWLFVLSVFYFFWHTATFFFVPGVAVLFFAFEDFYGKKKDFLNVGSVFGGVLFSMFLSWVFAPGLFAYMRDIIFGVFYDTIIGKKIAIPEGGELYPVDFFDFVRSNVVILFLFITAAALEIYRYIGIKRKRFSYAADEIENLSIRGTLFFLSTLFLLGIFISGRNMDFFLFFVAAYIAISANYIIRHINISHVVVKVAVLFGISLTTLFLFVSTSLSMRIGISQSSRFEAFEGVANWLNNNTEHGSVVFNSSWSWFPSLFYYNSDNYYVVGIEPRFLYDYDHEMYWKWSNMTSNGYLCAFENCDDLKNEQKIKYTESEDKKGWYRNQGDLMAESIVNDFNSRFVISSDGQKKMNDIFDNNEHFKKVYYDENNGLSVYNVR